MFATPSSLSEQAVDHRWIYPGHCLQTIGGWSWVPFRNHCYAFNLNQLRLQHEAQRTCKKGNACTHNVHVHTYHLRLTTIIKL